MTSPKALRYPSPRSSTSSSSDPSLPPLTPMFDLEDALSIPKIETAGEVEKTGFGDFSFGSTTGRDLVEGPTNSNSTSEGVDIPTPVTHSYSRVSPRLRSHSPKSNSVDDGSPQVGFSFGTCPTSIPLQATPTAEMGAFEYPSPALHSSRPNSDRGSFDGPPPHSSASAYTPLLQQPQQATSSRHSFDTTSPYPFPNMARRSSLADSLSYLNSNSMIASIHARAQAVASGKKTNPSPPVSRRSSTCSTIATIPVAGRRPSVLHSVSIPGPSVDDLDSSSNGSGLSTLHSALSHAAQSQGNLINSTPRRSSLLFQQRPVPGPIPPSLLTSRRGSLPASQLFGLPLNLNPLSDSLPTIPPTHTRTRSSFSAGIAQAHGFTTTTPQLYHRRESIVSEDGVSSSGSSRTIQGDESYTRRASLRRTSDARPEEGGESVGYVFGGRRASLPHVMNPPPAGSLLSTRRPSVIPSLPPSSTDSPCDPVPPSPKPKKHAQPITSSPLITSSQSLAHHRRSRQSSSTATSISTRSGLSLSHSFSSSSSNSDSSSSNAHSLMREKEGGGSSSECSTEEELEEEDGIQPLVSIPRGSVGGMGVGFGYSNNNVGYSDNKIQPGGGGGGPTFSDPWAGTSTSPTDDTIVKEKSDDNPDGKFVDEVERRSSFSLLSGVRPTLETIDSEETERGDAGT